MEHRRIPNRLKKYRKLVGYSQQMAAAILELPNSSSLSKWERGGAYPSVPMLFQLSLLYDTHPYHLYQDLWQELKLNVHQRKRSLFPLSEDNTSNDEYL